MCNIIRKKEKKNETHHKANIVQLVTFNQAIIKQGDSNSELIICFGTKFRLSV